MDQQTIVRAVTRSNADAGYALAARVWVHLERMRERRPTVHQLCGAMFGAKYSNAVWHRVRRIVLAFEDAGIAQRVPGSFGRYQPTDRQL